MRWRRVAVLCGLLSFGGSVMGNGQGKTPEDWKKDKEAAEAEAAAIEAQKKLVEARSGLANAEAAASTAAFKATIGEVPSSGYNGDVTLKDGVGKMEAALLASDAVNIAARRIVDTIDPLSAGQASPGKLFLYAAAEVPRFDAWTAFNGQASLALKAFDEAKAATDALAPPKPGVKGLETPVAAAAGLTLEAANKLLGFFRTDYTIGGVELTLEDALLVNAVAGALNKQHWEAHVPARYDAGLGEAARLTLNTLKELSLLNARGKDLQPRLEQRAAELKEAAGKEQDRAGKQEMLDQEQKYRAAGEAWKAATTFYEATYGRLTQADDKGIAPLSTVIRERTLATALQGGARLMILKLHASGGSYYTKKNLWTFFGGMPIYHMGGTVASFALIDGQSGTVCAAGVVPVHGGFVKAGNLGSKLTHK